MNDACALASAIHHDFGGSPVMSRRSRVQTPFAFKFAHSSFGGALELVEFGRRIDAPSGVVIWTSQHPSAINSAAFLTAAAVVSRRSEMLPDVSVP